MNEPGTLTIGEHETLRIEVEGESYRIGAEDIRTLVFYGKVVPVLQVRKTAPPDDSSPPTTSIEGHAAINRSGKAVLIFTRAGYFIIPLVSFQRVARGEAVSAPLFPLRPDIEGGQV